MNTQKTPIFIAGALLSTLALSHSAHATVAVTLNGQPLATSAAPVQINGATLVPMRDVFEALGAQVAWNPVTQGINATTATTQIALGVNKNLASVNGRTVALAQAPLLLNGSVFVPLRFVAEATGAQVEWNNALQLVSIRQNLVAPPSGVPIISGNSTIPTNPTIPTIPLGGSQVAGYREISVPRGAVVPVKLDNALSSATTRVGSTFSATVVSNRLGDSEFPNGTKLEGLVVEARPSDKQNPGVLDVRFQAAVTPDGTRVPLRGTLTSLDAKNVSQQGGRLVAPGAKKNDRLKIIGIGAGAGYVLGRVLKTNSAISAILGAGGGYLLSRSRDKKAQEATLAANTTLGVRLQNAVSYRDAANYSNWRDEFLRTNTTRYAADDYGYDDRASVNASDPNARDDYNGYEVTDRLPAPATNDDRFVEDSEPIINDDRFYDTAEPIVNDDRASAVRAQRISIPEGAVVPVTLDREVSSATARVGEEISASVASQRLGDSEFPAGTRVVGRVIEARPRKSNEPGVLDLEFRTAITPDGRRIPLRGELVSLDEKSVQTQNGRIVAKAGQKNDRLKVIGIGAGVGYVLGRVLKQNGLISAVLGAAGGLLLDKTQSKKAAEAVVPAGARLGVRLNNNVKYDDNSYYAYRSQYLRLN